MSKVLNNFYAEDTLEVGLDEVGRGPLFGRVYVGACIFPPEGDHSLIRDSKKLSERKRLIAVDYIKENAIDYTVYWEDEKKVDEINILQATQLAMHNAITKLDVRPDLILVDGTYFKPYIDPVNRIIPHVCIDGGDDKYISIAAASVLAKVARDQYIYDLCDKYDNLDEYYGIRSNKGYGAKRHIEGIKAYGITEWHRKSFRPCCAGYFNKI